MAQKSGANGMEEGDLVRYKLDGRRARVEQFIQDGGAYVRWEDGDSVIALVRWEDLELVVARARRPVIQDWVSDLSFMQQTVLLTAVRGPDGVRKDHIAKLVCRYLRRCVLLSAFDRCALENPVDPRGGSFTGPSVQRRGPEWRIVGDIGKWFDSAEAAMDEIVSRFIRATDELPHHFTMHIKNAAQVLGFKHPEQAIRMFWLTFYFRLCDDLHANPETYDQFNKRLGDNEQDWLAAGDRSSCGREDCAPGATAYTFADEKPAYPNPRDRTQVDLNFQRDANTCGGASAITGEDLG